MIGYIEAGSTVGLVSVMYREVGASEWIDLGQVSDSFSFGIAEADGEKDFEFVTATRFQSVEVLSDSTIIYNLAPFANTSGYGGYGA